MVLAVPRGGRLTAALFFAPRRKNGPVIAGIGLSAAAELIAGVVSYKYIE